MRAGRSTELLCRDQRNAKAALLAQALDEAVEQVLDRKKCRAARSAISTIGKAITSLRSIGPRAWRLRRQDQDLAAHFRSVAGELQDRQDAILSELRAGQGQACDLGGYFLTDALKTAAVMRPSPTLNAIIG